MGGALKAAPATTPGRAACGGAVLLAPELHAAALNVKGAGNFLAALRAAALAQELSVLIP